LNLTDDILLQFGDVSPVGFSVASGSLTANPQWNGSAASNSLPVGGSGNVFITYTVTPASNALARDNKADVVGVGPGRIEVFASSTEPVVLLSLGNFVWYDYDNDGIPDTTEPPVAGVLVKLVDAARSSRATSPTAPVTTSSTCCRREAIRF